MITDEKMEIKDMVSSINSCYMDLPFVFVSYSKADAERRLLDGTHNTTQLDIDAIAVDMVVVVETIVAQDVLTPIV